MKVVKKWAVEISRGNHISCTRSWWPYQQVSIVVIATFKARFITPVREHNEEMEKKLFVAHIAMATN